MRSPRRTLTAALATLALGFGALAAAPAASAEPVHLDWQAVTGQTTLVKPDPDVVATLPTSRFTADVDLATGQLTGDLVVPDMTVKMKALNLLPMTATVRLVPVGQSTGTVDLGANKITANSTFEMQIVKLTQDWVPKLNLVSSGCRTSAPSTAELVNTTPIDLFNGTTLAGEFDVSSFKGCGLLTPILSTLLSGPDNPITITLK